MLIRNIILFVVTTIVNVQYSTAQIISRPLQIGDTIPSFQSSVINYKGGESIDLSKIRGKPCILDFWATWCAPCVQGLIHLLPLQNEFKNQINIIPVAYESRERIKNFFKNIKKTKVNIFDFSIVNDSVFQKLFPHQTIPHLVFIDKSGVVKAITYPDQLNEKNINDLLEGFQLHLPEKNELLMSVSTNSGPDSTAKPVSVRLFKDNPTVEECHYWGRYVPGQPGGAGWDNNFINISNGSIMMLYEIAYGKGMHFFGGWNSVELLTHDSSRFTDNSGPNRKDQYYRFNWKTENDHEFNYFLVVPLSDSLNKWEKMKRDLEAKFPYISARIDSQMRNVLVLKSTGQQQKFKSRENGKPDFDFNPFRLKGNRIFMDIFDNTLKRAYQESPFIIVDETGYKGFIDVDINARISNYEELNLELKKIDLELVLDNRKVDILVITDKRDINR